MKGDSTHRGKTGRALFAKKSLGQNFLHNKGVLKSMVNAATISSNETVLEIGPGKGTLTEVLLESNSKVIAIEKDDRLIPILTQKFESQIKSGQLFLIHGDILNESISQYIQEKPYVVVANIPYYITGAILTQFLEAQTQPSRMVLMVQKEVAVRIIARNKKASILSLSIQVFSTPSLVQKVSKELFSPKPKVDSAILLLNNIHNPFQTMKDREVFFQLIKKAFNQKRKTVGNTLKDIPIQILHEANINEKMRPEDITLDSWITLSRLYQPE